MFIRTALLLLSLTLIACNSDDDNDNGEENAQNTANINPYEGYASSLYDGPENWLCRPDQEAGTSICDADLSSTIVFADGSTTLEASPTATDQAVDCFYVYPTISGDAGDNADLVPGAEIGAVLVQAARYRSVCRLFVPLYRQKTSNSIATGSYSSPEVNQIAYDDVLDAFKYFIANNDGRGFMLVGHSQGTEHLIQLVQDEVEASDFLAERMVSAHLIGFRVALPNDAETGATFMSTPPCTFENDIHCFVNYSSFRVTAPPLNETALFGITDSPDTRSPCTHPVALGAGLLELDAYFSPVQLPAYSNQADNFSITTPFVKLPGLLFGECIEEDGKGYLAITVNSDPDDPRVDDVIEARPDTWGLHSIDIALAQGDLIRLAETQVQRWLDD